MMKKLPPKPLMNRLKGKSFLLGFIVIVALAAVIRFYELPSYISIGGDDARDIAIAKESIRLHTLPRFGSFSSAGPFVFGPLFYWVLIVSYLLIPFTLLAPWIMTVIASLFMVAVMMLIGKKIGGTQLGLIFGFLTTFSPQLIIRSVVVGQHTYVAIFTTLTILFFILLWQQQRKLFAFLLGLMIGIAINMHYQALNLIIILPFILLVPKVELRRKILFTLLVIAGIIAASLPLLAWDARQQFANIRNILDYFLIGQYRLYVPNSWRLFIFSFLPTFWAYVIGGWYQLGLMAIVVSAFGGVFSLRNDRSRLTLCLCGIVGIFLVTNRYYHGERSEGYFLYLTPFLIIITGIGIAALASEITRLMKSKAKFMYLEYLCIAIVLLPFIIGGLMRVGFSNGKIQSINEVRKTVESLKKARPHTVFALYDQRFQHYSETTGLSAFLEDQHLESAQGTPLGFFCPGAYKKNKYPVITTMVNGCMIDDLSSTTRQIREKEGWVLISQHSLYDDLITRWESQHLTSSFSLSKYILWRFKH